ncbi:hypothetical protein VLK31_24410 [Variovorax sp. H27-G14]|uniref:hypothetical protein n=1 Tax=Variovorax sp. H27-G14 TaxID=3111914 RepID=UPI0038FCB57F
MAAPNTPSPAIATLKSVLKAEFPQIDTQTGIGNQPASRHTSGIALDIMLNYKRDADARIGRRIMAGLVKNFEAMQWSAFIFTVRNPTTNAPVHFWVRGADGTGYGGRKLEAGNYSADTRHEDHIHIDWVNFSMKNTGAEYTVNPYKQSEASKLAGFGAALGIFLKTASDSEVDAIVDTMFAKLPVSAPKTPTPEWARGWWTVQQEGQTYYYFIDDKSGASWTYTRPMSQNTPMSNRQNGGNCTFGNGGDMKISWTPLTSNVATVETFKGSGGALAGTSNRGGALSAAKV